jgi:hypothetical protein
MANQQFEQAVDTIRTLTGISQADFDLLHSVEAEAAQWTDEVVKLFYDTLFGHPRTAAVFHAGERPDREKTLADWYRAIFNASDTPEFWEKQGRIGFAHIRRHVNNEFMIGMASKLVQFFTQKAVETFGPQKGVPVALSFERALKAVVGLTAEGYDVASQAAFTESTGADAKLVNRLIQESVDIIQKEWLK